MSWGERLAIRVSAKAAFVAKSPNSGRRGASNAMSARGASAYVAAMASCSAAAKVASASSGNTGSVVVGFIARNLRQPAPEALFASGLVVGGTFRRRQVRARDFRRARRSARARSSAPIRAGTSAVKVTRRKSCSQPQRFRGAVRAGDSRNVIRRVPRFATTSIARLNCSLESASPVRSSSQTQSSSCTCLAIRSASSRMACSG